MRLFKFLTKKKPKQDKPRIRGVVLNTARLVKQWKGELEVYSHAGIPQSYNIRNLYIELFTCSGAISVDKKSITLTKMEAYYLRCVISDMRSNILAERERIHTSIVHNKIMNELVGQIT